MGINFWLEKWRIQDTPFNQQVVNPLLLRYLHLLNLKQNEVILVPLCGKSIDMIWLAKQDYAICGVELSPIACHDFFTENALDLSVTVTKSNDFMHYQCHTIEIFCGNFFDLTQTDLPFIKAVYDRAALIALPPKLQKIYAKQIALLVSQGARVLLISIETTCEVEGPPFPVNNSQIKSLFGADFKIEEISREIKQEVSPHLIKIGYHNITDVVYLLTRN